MTAPTLSPSPLLDAPVLAPDGRATTLREAAGDGGLVAYFMRTFDCPACRAHVRQYVAGAARVADAGARIVVIGPGSAAEAASLRDELGVPFAVVADPDGTAYAAGGFGRGFGGLQQSGTLGFDASGREVFAYRTTLPLRRGDFETLLDALKGGSRGR